MKLLSFKIVATVVATLFSIQLFSQAVQTTTFTVLGNCDMCKKRIEAAANKVKGVEAAKWDAGRQVVVLTYNTTIAKPEDVGAAIANAGYDNQYATGDDKAYKKLPACCKYVRKKE